SFLEFHGLAGTPQHQVRNDKRRNAGGDPRLLDVDPPPRSIARRSPGPVQLSKGTSATPDQESWPDLAQPTAITTLGELRTDNAGRLIVIPGEGATAVGQGVGGVHHYANNDGWFDDVGDGPITASLKMRNQNGSGTPCDVVGARLPGGPAECPAPLAGEGRVAACRAARLRAATAPGGHPLRRALGHGRPPPHDPA